MDIIGLSGLITPSLEEMAFVAGEMEREGFTIPLLIGGATTSRVHTAVKIAPHYHGPIVHVLDASRAVGVAGNLLSDSLRDGFVAGVRAEYDGHAGTRAEPDAREERRQPIADARREPAGHRLDAATPPVPCFTGVADLRRLSARRSWCERIDWTPFFQTWELRGPLPGHPRRSRHGRGGAPACSATRRRCSTGSCASGCSARAACSASSAANAVGDDIELYADEDARPSSSR